MVKLFRYLTFSMFVFAVTSCVLSYSSGNDLKIKQKTIDGSKYFFMTKINYKDKNIFGFRSHDINIELQFKGGDMDISEKLSFDDLQRKAGTKLPETVVLDSVSFEKDDYGDGVVLGLYLSNKLLPMKLSYKLVPEGDKWVLK
jgi:hypothetical protein